MSDKMRLSIAGEDIPFTMQAEIGHMTMDEAIASGLFDLPDEPGLVRIPVSLNVFIPNSVLHPPPPPRASPTDTAHGVPPSSRRRTRFGNYPKAVAARNIARTFRSPAVDQAERDDFRTLLGVLHPRQGPRAPDDTPVQLACLQEDLSFGSASCP